jgi:hypothetical protein
MKLGNDEYILRFHDDDFFGFRSSGLRHQVVFYVDTDIPKENAAIIFRSKVNGSGTGSDIQRDFKSGQV